MGLCGRREPMSVTPNWVGCSVRTVSPRPHTHAPGASLRFPPTAPSREEEDRRCGTGERTGLEPDGRFHCGLVPDQASPPSGRPGRRPSFVSFPAPVTPPRPPPCSPLRRWTVTHYAGDRLLALLEAAAPPSSPRPSHPSSSDVRAFSAPGPPPSPPPPPPAPQPPPPPPPPPIQHGP